MNNPQCRIWSKIEIQNKIDMLDYGPKTKRDERTTQNFLIEVSYVKELRYIDPYCKVSVNRSLIVVPFDNLFDRIYWCQEQTGQGGWKSLHTKITYYKILSRYHFEDTRSTRIQKTLTKVEATSTAHFSSMDVTLSIQ